MSNDYGLAGAALQEEIGMLRSSYPNLPDAYLNFLGLTNGGEGPLGVEPGWYVIWSAEEAAVATDQYQMHAYLPGYFAFGGNGGGELFVFSIWTTASTVQSLWFQQ